MFVWDRTCLPVVVRGKHTDKAEMGRSFKQTNRPTEKLFLYVTLV